MVVVGAVHSAVVADQLLAGLTVVDEGALVVDTVAELGTGYAAGGAITLIEDTSDWLSVFFTLELYFLGLASFYFLVGDLDGVLEGDFEASLDFYFYLSLPLLLLLPD